MLDFGGNEEHTPSGNFRVLISGVKTGASTDYVIHFIFMMGTLLVGAAGWEYIEPCTHGGDTEKLEVESLSLRATLLQHICSEYGYLRLRHKDSLQQDSMRLFN